MMIHEKISSRNQIQILEAARSGCPFCVLVQDLTVTSWSQSAFHIPLRVVAPTKSAIEARKRPKTRWIFSTNLMLTCTN
jgi:hypothetical protein